MALQIKRAQEWEEHRYEVKDGVSSFLVFQDFNSWYVKPAGGWRTVDRTDICKLAKETFEEECKRRQAECASRQQKQKKAPVELTVEEALECWLGEGVD